MTLVRFTAPQATPDGLKTSGDVVDVPDHLARKYVDFGRAEIVRRRGRPPKETTRSTDRAGYETR